jgi:hypothetical protein
MTFTIPGFADISAEKIRMKLPAQAVRHPARKGTSVLVFP